MTVSTWLPEEVVFAQLAFADADEGLLTDTVRSLVVALALRHDVSPAQIAVGLLTTIPAGDTWRRIETELRRVLDAVKRGEG